MSISLLEQGVGYFMYTPSSGCCRLNLVVMNLRKLGLFLFFCGLSKTSKVLAKVYWKLQTPNTPTLYSCFCCFSDVQGPYTESASVVGGVLSLIIILIIGGSALGFTILILKIKKLKSEKQ